MHVVVVYESMFGNTRDIALQVISGLQDTCRVDAYEVRDAPTVLAPDTRLLVLGGPTHAFGMSRPATRTDAHTKSDQPLVSTGRGIRDWLKEVHIPAGCDTAVFDTKMAKPLLPGSAAASAAKYLRRTIKAVVLDRETFWVMDMTGPLKEGEGERAHEWGAQLARTLQAAATAG